MDVNSGVLQGSNTSRPSLVELEKGIAKLNFQILCEEQEAKDREHQAEAQLYSIPVYCLENFGRKGATEVAH